MKKHTNVLLLILFAHCFQAQEKSNYFEFGSNLVTFNHRSNFPYPTNYKQRVEFINGLFFRYTKNRVALRALVSYSEYSYSLYYPAQMGSNLLRSEMSNRDLRMGLGGQLYLFKKVKWLYGFTDVLYRRVISKGFTYTEDPVAHSIQKIKSNGLDAFLGLGVNVKIISRIFLCAEVSCNVIFQNDLHSVENERAFTFRGYGTNVNPVSKLGLVCKIP